TATESWEPMLSGTKEDSFFFSSRRRHTRSDRDWSSDVCSSDLALARIKSYHDYGTFTPIQVASIVALEGAQDCVEEHRMKYQKRSEERRVGKEGRYQGASEL